MVDLFKLQGEIEVQIAKAVDNLNTLSLKASEVAAKIKNGIGGKNQANIDTSKSVNALTKLNSKVQRQTTELEILKDRYQDVYLAEGKNSTQAKQLANQIDKLSSELKENRSKLDESRGAADKFDKSLHDLDDSSKNLSNGGFTVLKGAIANLLSNGFQKLVSGISNLISSAGSYQSSMEQYTTSFEVMTGSAEKAASVTTKLGEVAASTPFELTNLADTTQLLMNYGFTADDAISKMQMLGDISQGSSDKMTRIAMAYGQMSSAGKVSLEDVKQMIEAGFNPLQEISQTTGESMSSLYDRISKGTISIDEITASMERSTAEGGKYFGSMDKQSQTLSGRLSTLKDTINSSLGTVLNGILQKLADNVIPKITAAMEKVDWEGIGNTLGNIFEKLIELAGWIIDNFDLVSSLIIGVGVAFATWNIVTKIQAVIKAVKAWTLATEGMTVAQRLLNLVMKANPIGIVITAVTTLITVFVLLWNKCDGFRKFWQNLWSGIKNVFSNAWSGIKSAATISWDGILNIFKGVGNWFNNSVVNPIKNAFSSAWNDLKLGAVNAWNGIKNVFSNVASWFKNIFTNAWTAVKNVFSVGGKIFDGIKDGIVNAFKTIVNGIIKGINKVVSIPFNGINWVLKKIKSIEIFGLKPFNWVGTINVPQIPLLRKGGILEKGQVGLLEGDGAEAVVPLDQNKKWVSKVAEDFNSIQANADANDDVLSRLNKIIDLLINGQNIQLVLDTGVLVGQMTNKIDAKLGQINVMKGRGN